MTPLRKLIIFHEDHVQPWIPLSWRRRFNLWKRRVKGEYGMWRIRTGVTRWLGPQYRRSRDMIEIDITYACNLHCFNCSRSCEQACASDDISPDQIQAFVRESIAKGIRWRRIRILGGEPTLHPRLFEILDILRSWRDTHSTGCRIELHTNGFGESVREVLSRVPADVYIRSTQKESPVQTHFVTFNVAPVDVPGYEQADYTSGCSMIQNCGMGMAPTGYYPCSVAGGIDRIFGLNLGRPTPPGPDDDMQDLLETFCPLCGIFKRRQNSHPLLRPEMSKTWEAAYARWRNERSSGAALVRFPAAEDPS